MTAGFFMLKVYSYGFAGRDLHLLILPHKFGLFGIWY